MAAASWAMDAREVGDRLAIRELIDRFSLAMTRHDATAIPPLFVAEGSWGSGAPFDFTVSGADAIGQAIAHGKSGADYSIHMVHSVVIDLDGDEASATTVLEEVTRQKEAGGMTNYGLYHDALRRTGEGWRFVSRRFEFVCMDRTAPAAARVPGSASHEG